MTPYLRGNKSIIILLITDNNFGDNAKFKSNKHMVLCVYVGNNFDSGVLLLSL